MPNPLFEPQGNRRQPVTGGGIFGMVFNRIYQTNPAFWDFANSAQGKSIDDICREKGIDPRKVTGMSPEEILQFLSKNGLV